MPIPVDEFSLPKLIDAINYMLDSQVKNKFSQLDNFCSGIARKAQTVGYASS